MAASRMLSNETTSPSSNSIAPMWAHQVISLSAISGVDSWVPRWRLRVQRVLASQETPT